MGLFHRGTIIIVTCIEYYHSTTTQNKTSIPRIGCVEYWVLYMVRIETIIKPIHLFLILKKFFPNNTGNSWQIRKEIAEGKKS